MTKEVILEIIRDFIYKESLKHTHFEFIAARLVEVEGASIGNNVTKLARCIRGELKLGGQLGLLYPPMAKIMGRILNEIEYETLALEFIDQAMKETSKC